MPPVSHGKAPTAEGESPAKAAPEEATAREQYQGNDDDAQHDKPLLSAVQIGISILLMQTADKARKRKILSKTTEFMLPALAAPANDGHLRSGKLPYLRACRLVLQTFQAACQDVDFVNILYQHSADGLIFHKSLKGKLKKTRLWERKDSR